MAGEFKFGALLSWKGFEFEDGGVSDKLLLVLGCRTGQNGIAILATSKQHNRGLQRGCFVDCGYFFIPAGEAKFKKNTWLELYRPQEVSAAQILKGGFAKEVHVVMNLPQQLANEIRNCLKRSNDLSKHQASLLE